MTSDRRQGDKNRIKTLDARVQRLAAQVKEERAVVKELRSEVGWALTFLNRGGCVDQAIERLERAEEF